MAARYLRFGVEIETSVEPFENEYRTPQQHYVKFAQRLTNKYGLRAVGNSGTAWPPERYNKWWITTDGSILIQPNCIQMESVSPIMKSDDRWEYDIESFWDAMNDLFHVKRNLTCGTHIHVSPSQGAFTLQQAKTVAFACCYYEQYVVSCLPAERRDYKYCKRNTNVAERMGSLHRMQTPQAMRRINYEIRSLQSFTSLVIYMQNGLGDAERRVLWNFQNLVQHGDKKTIEFRGGRHVRGPKRTIRWITFAIVFVLMALNEDTLNRYDATHVPNNDRAAEVQSFWLRFRRFASTLDMHENLPEHFKMMSEKM